MAAIMDMDGRVLHRWTLRYEEIFPQSERAGSDFYRYWRRVHMFPNGDLLAISDGKAIFKIDRNSKLLWGVENGAHHDLQVMGDGKIWVLTRTAHVLERVAPEPVLEGFVTLLDTEGKEIRSFSLLEAFEKAPFKKIWPGK